MTDDLLQHVESAATAVQTIVHLRRQLAEARAELSITDIARRYWMKEALKGRTAIPADEQGDAQ